MTKKADTKDIGNGVTKGTIEKEDKHKRFSKGTTWKDIEKKTTSQRQTKVLQVGGHREAHPSNQLRERRHDARPTKKEKDGYPFYLRQGTGKGHLS